MDIPEFYSTNRICYVGATLRNIGNNCFLNAILQCLTHTVPLVDTLLSFEHSSTCTRDGEDFCPFCTLTDHVHRCLRLSGFYFTPKSFIINLPKISSDFLPGQQEDAHEFLCCLLDKLHQSYLFSDPTKPASFELDSPIKRIFGGRIRSQVHCCDCGHITNTYEPLIDLSLEIDDESCCTVNDALTSFTKLERIDDPENKFPCEGCKGKVSVDKQIKLVDAPQVVILNLKRFKVVDASYISKICKFIEFPLELDLRLFVASPEDGMEYKYDLYAVVEHAGPANDGHYYSFIRSTPKVWHLLNDERVFRFCEDLVLSRSAYILFYVKRGSSPCVASMLQRMFPKQPRFIRRSESSAEKKSEENSDLQIVEIKPESIPENPCSTTSDNAKAMVNDDNEMKREEYESANMMEDAQNDGDLSISKKRKVEGNAEAVDDSENSSDQAIGQPVAVPANREETKEEIKEGPDQIQNL